MKAGKILLVQLCLLLAACQGGKGDDLDQFIADAAKDMRVKVDPLPEVLPYTPMEYNADGTLVNPFKARKAIADAASKLQPDMNRPREPLESYPLESLKFVGSMEKQQLKYGLIQTPDNSVQQVKIGNYMGQNFGMVTDILESGVVLKEIVRDDLSGDWVERTANVDLQD
ncbi:MAG: pilus assembly protein PilP [Betaproteobacteria bacterium HGW-Betaproteobacteria-2]|jgi:type IV pilus assembly protein PilP|nr:MAG: pilus assembly protein PilP [Betaproteobacteria bacterium HGW-Betaproteobacteria-2]PKO92696.1 MAG: pilus assembly protein PilP [Betaproteobacteria bacterium HGW-Betaproteobacteria-1]